MSRKGNYEKSANATTSAPAKKLYLIRAEDVERFVTSASDGDSIVAITLKPGGRVVQIDDNPEGRSVLTSNIRRIVGEKATTRLISGTAKPKKIDA